MKKQFLSFKEKLTASAQRMAAPSTAVALAIASAMRFAPSAAGGDPMGVVKSIADILVDLFPPIGIILVLFGGFKIVMAVRNDQPEAIKTAVMDVVVGVVLVVFKTFLWEPISALLG